MELKDVILSTLAEMEETPKPKEITPKHFQPEITEELPKKKVVQKTQQIKEKTEEVQTSNIDGEVLYLNSIRERMLVLFEGFQSPNNTNLEAKVDMTLNFLEYVLATIDTRLEILEKGNKS